MINELIFFLYAMVIAGAALVSVWLSREALIAFLCIQMVLINLFVTKEILFFGFVATSADVLGIGIALSLNLIQEYYGIERAKQGMWLGFYSAILYVVLALLQCAYIPGPADTTQEHFLALLMPMPRIIAASLVSFLISQTVDRHLYAYLKRALHGGYFITRNHLSIMLTQLLDTVLFSFLGLYGVMSNLGSIILVSYCIKLLAIVLVVPFLAFAHKLVRRPSIAIDQP